jgi:hypothetical protein
MHHAEIGNLIQIIKDYFLLSEVEPKCEIEPWIDPNTMNGWQNGIIIRCSLKNGYMILKVDTPHEDNTDFDASYYQPSSNEPIQSFYTTIDRARGTFREIINLDIQAGKDKLIIEDFEMQQNTNH